MKRVAPDYYKRFVCTADKCRDNCCRVGWRIAVDDDTYKSYISRTEDIFKRFYRDIESDSEGYFIHGGCCSMLRDDGLCEIALRFGEENLGYICKMHPRYINEYSDIEEYGIGLACEEAARLIMTDENPNLYDVNEDINSKTEELTDRLIDTRKKLIDFVLENGRVEDKVAGALIYAEKIAPLAANGEYEKVKGVTLETLTIDSKRSYENIAEMLDVFKGLEVLDEEWIEMLDSAKKDIKAEESKSDDELKRIFCYFLYRYFVLYSLDGDMLGAVKLAAISVILLRELFCGKDQEERICIAHMYSKEIEYDDENLSSLMFDFFVNEVFETEEIIKML